MSNSVNQLNQRISNLYALVGQSGGGGGGSQSLSQVLVVGNDAGGQDITNVDNLDVTTINGSAYPPLTLTPDLSDVLTAGNSATNNILLNNYDILTPAQQNLISLLPNASSTNPNITLTDGTTTNTIDKNGYTTRSSVQNSTHYLNFSDSSATGTGAIQKTYGIQCNPSVGSINLESPAASANTGVITLSPDLTANNPTITLTDGTTTNTITKTGMSGLAGSATNATNATNVVTLSDNTNTTCYIPFQKTTSGTSQLFLDDTTGPLSYNPFTSTLTASIFKPTTLLPSGITLGGGLLFSTGVYNYSVFLSGANLVISGSGFIDYLMVGGGGGGGTNAGGGGGAGGVIVGTNVGISSGTYPITIGTAGAALGNGGNTTFNSLTAGGGGGGSNSGSVGSAGLATNGNGGGGGGNNNNGGAGNGSGFGGGFGAQNSSLNTGGGGGGGGAGAVGGACAGGQTAGALLGGIGGAGITSTTIASFIADSASTINAVVSGWTTATTGGIIAGGGGGGSWGASSEGAGGTPGARGGTGGGGRSGNLSGSGFATTTATAGFTNTGSGGGGAAITSGGTGVGAAGGTGIVIIRTPASGVLNVNSTLTTTSLEFPTGQSIVVKMPGLPTSASGLVSGDVWRNGSVLNIVP